MVLVDTNVHLRLVQPEQALSEICWRAVDRLSVAGHEMFVFPQNLIEFWAVATRPSDQNGLGFSTENAARELLRIRGMFTLIPDSAAVYPIWEHLVIQFEISGKVTHD